MIAIARILRRRLEGIVFLVALLLILPLMLVRLALYRINKHHLAGLLTRWGNYLRHGLDDLRKAYWPGIRYETTRDIWFHILAIEWFAMLNVSTHPPRRCQRQSPQRILVIKLAHFGDALHIFPMLQELRKQCPDAQVDLMVGPWCEELAKIFSKHDMLLIYSPRLGVFDRGNKPQRFSIWQTVKIWRKLRARRYDLVISTSTTSLAEALLMQVVSAAQWVGTHLPGRLFNPIGDTRLVAYDSREYESVRVTGLLRLCGLSTGRAQLYFPLTSDDHASAANLLEEHRIGSGSKYAVLAPGAGWPGKQWLPERFAEIGDRIQQQYGLQVLFIGSRSEQPLCDQICASMKSQAIALAGTTSLKQLASIISKASLFVGNDSGPMHVAACFEVPSLVLFGPTIASKWAPRHAAVKVLQHEDCSGCVSWHFRAKCLHHNRCMKAITVEEAWRAVQELMAQETRS